MVSRMIPSEVRVPMGEEVGVPLADISPRRRDALWPFTALVGLRLLFVFLTAVTLVWAPVPSTLIPSGRAYGGFTDLLFGAFDHWDADYFVHIAQHGYDEPRLPAFFPGYPLAVRGVHYVFGSYLVSGVVVSLVAAGIAALLIAAIAKDILGRTAARDSVIYLALFPTAFVFTAAYSDALFVAFASGAFLAALRQRPWLAALLVGLATGTRSLGLALVPAVGYLLWSRVPSRWWRPVPTLAAAAAAIGAFALYLQHRRGDALAFAHAQSEWMRGLATYGPLSGLKQAITDGLNSTDLVVRHLPEHLGAPGGFDRNYENAMWDAVHLLLLAIAVTLTVVAWRRLGPAFGLYSAGVLVITLSEPVAGFALQSLPRFMLDDFPLVIALAAVTLSRPAARTWTIATLAVLTTVAGIGFSRGVWIA